MALKGNHENLCVLVTDDFEHLSTLTRRQVRTLVKRRDGVIILFFE